MTCCLNVATGHNNFRCCLQPSQLMFSLLLSFSIRSSAAFQKYTSRAIPTSWGSSCWGCGLLIHGIPKCRNWASTPLILSPTLSVLLSIVTSSCFHRSKQSSTTFRKIQKTKIAWNTGSLENGKPPQTSWCEHVWILYPRWFMLLNQKSHLPQRDETDAWSSSTTRFPFSPMWFIFFNRIIPAWTELDVSNFGWHL